MFSTKWYNTGTVLYQATSGGLLLDMTDATSLNVKYDVNQGWDFGNQGYGTAIAPKSNFGKFLNQAM